ncbi:MAG: cyclic nucleotide-binding domain-containing protein, partial [Gemmatimonadota bacterium]
ALFEGLAGGDLDEILDISEPVLVEADELVFEEGDRGDHFYIIVRGEVELRKAAGRGIKRLALLRAGQAFGEMALLNQTPRSASALAVSDTYMLAVSREAFGRILGGETLAVRLLRNLSKALWATSVRLAARQAQQARSDTPHEALADFNRLLRTRLLPRVTPRVSGYDLSASTLAPRQGVGSSGWDWFLLPDGRPAFVIVKSVRADIFSAQRLNSLRTILRSLAQTPQQSLGALLTHAGRGIRAAWVDGLSGSVSCGLVALAEGSAEWVGAGDVAGMVVRAGGASRDLNRGTPALGDQSEHVYESTVIDLGARDKLICMSESPTNTVQLVTSVVTGGYTSSSRDALSKLFARFGQSPQGPAGGVDLSGFVITCTKPTP